MENFTSLGGLIMTIDKIVEILENKLTTLRNELNTYTIIGDLEGVARIELEIAETQTSIDKIKSV